MAGYWPSDLHTRLIYSHIDRRSLVNKRFIIWLRRKLFQAGPTQEIPGGKDGPILTARVANQKAGFTLSRPLADSVT